MKYLKYYENKVDRFYYDLGFVFDYTNFQNKKGPAKEINTKLITNLYRYLIDYIEDILTNQSGDHFPYASFLFKDKFYISTFEITFLSDEWFTIEFQETDEDNANYSSTYWSCDGEEGLINFINDYIVNFNDDYNSEEDMD